jgi:hypothetical protein
MLVAWKSMVGSICPTDMRAITRPYDRSWLGTLGARAALSVPVTSAGDVGRISGIGSPWRLHRHGVHALYRSAAQLRRKRISPHETHVCCGVSSSSMR